MKRAAFLLALLLSLAFPARAQYVNGSVNSGTVASLSCTVPNTGAGDTFVLDTFTGNSTAVSSVKDQIGNTVQLVPGTAALPWGNGSDGFIERLYSGKNTAGGTLIVTIAYASSVYNECYLFDYKSMTLDSAAPGKATKLATAASSNPITTTNANDLLFSFVHAGGSGTSGMSVITPAAGWNTRLYTPATWQGGMDRSVTATGTYTASVTSGTTNYAIFLAAFKLSTPAPPSVTIGTITINIGTNPVGHSVSVTWFGSTGAIGYNVYRSSGSSYAVLNPSPIGLLNYTDLTVQSGMTYHYFVTAVGPACPTNPVCGESTGSNQVIAVIPSP